MNKAVFLDRDGTINFDSGYISDPNLLVLLDGSVEALKIFQKEGFKLIVITNQSGIGRGFYSEEQCKSVNNRLAEMLKNEGVEITDSFVCPHAPDEGCSCRKPSPELVLKAAAKYDIDLSESYMFGDKNSDVECGKNSGAKSYLITEKENLLFWANKLLNKQI